MRAMSPDVLPPSTDQVFATLQQSPILKQLPREELARFAEASDFVRYAKAVPTVDDCKAHLELGYRVIHGTQAALPPRRPATTPTPGGG